ncbi:3-isopropylmalate dehydratase small subunit [Candidatus Bathyarchaeota archaeon]|nr:3-isopropylmalate dehydratase small subunit [Candidatus Bathyarchaeota archaeon]RJS75038.1 MAG: 3-isopropylmalate dehydratase small subunit [Candidatus Bathyarchaeota archaeon]
MKVRGYAVKYGDNIDTDVIIPGRYLGITDPEELGRHAMEGLDPEFPSKIKQTGILVAGVNFGCGSSREEAPLALKYSGVKCIIAKSFARIFFRNAINVGLPIVICPEAVGKIEEGDELTIDLAEGTIVNESKDETYRMVPLPKFILDILRDGGLIPHLRRKGF